MGVNGESDDDDEGGIHIYIQTSRRLTEDSKKENLRTQDVPFNKERSAS